MADLILSRKTDKGLFSSKAYSVNDADITLEDLAEESALPELRITAIEINCTVADAEIIIAVNENGKVSRIVDIDTLKFGTISGEIAIDGIKANAVDLY